MNNKLKWTYYSINSDSRKYSWRVWSPGNIPDSCMKVKDEQWCAEEKENRLGIWETLSGGCC